MDQKVLATQENAYYKHLNDFNEFRKYGSYDLTTEQKFFYDKLLGCGDEGKKHYYCKKCENDNKPALVAVKKTYFYCGLKYCNHTDCKVYEFARRFNILKKLPNLKNLKTLQHFVIGFPRISLYDFQFNFSKIKQRYFTIINNFIAKCKKEGVELVGFNVFDLEFEIKLLNQEVYPHFHFAIKPFERRSRRQNLIKIKKIEKTMIQKQRIHTPFHVQFFKHGAKNAVLSYLTIRSIGLYKHNRDTKPDYVPKNKGNLKKALKSRKYAYLSDFLTKQQYLNQFYKKRHFSTFGGFYLSLYGPSTTDNDFLDCKVHGPLTASDCRLEVSRSVSSDVPPPDPVVYTIIKINR